MATQKKTRTISDLEDTSMEIHSSSENKPHVYSVTDISKAIKGVLEDVFDSTWIEGEISNLRVPASKHSYFVLKDDNSQIRCVMFRNSRAGIKFEPADGDQVLVYGRVGVYEARGEYQVIVENMEPLGLGALQKAYEQLKLKLEKEGLFDEASKKPLPEYPWKVGVITSDTGAAVRDIFNIMHRRNPKVSILLHPVKVQGDGSAEEIATAIENMNRVNDVDVIIVGRGGGSIEDLWAFNEECVARAIYKSTIPIISAVGHEIDFTIADFVADLRAPTPSAAAELAVPRLDEMINQIVGNTRQLLKQQTDLIEGYKNQLKGLIDRRFFRSPRQIIELPSQRLDDLTQRLLRGLDNWVIIQQARLKGEVQKLFLSSPIKDIQSLKDKSSGLHHMLVKEMQSHLSMKKERLAGTLKNLHALSPLAILDRGYSICNNSKTGKAIIDSEVVNIGDQVTVSLAKGKLNCTVDNKIE
ncbi:MAG: exodeoxyribonuclease VII large subunit [Nitrospinales bacterium]